MRLINATPHAVNILGAQGELLLDLPPSGLVLRCETRTQPWGDLTVEGRAVPVTRTVLGEVRTEDGDPLPAPQPGVAYVVSALVRLAAPERDDLFSPGPLVRNGAGVVTGCLGLSR